MLKKILKSRFLKILISAVLIYLAFRKVNVSNLLGQLVGIKIWFLMANILIGFMLVSLISFRWSLLLIRKPKWKDILLFTKSSFAALFYGLFFPTAVAGDVMKWIIIDNKYPEISKTKLLGSVILDRFMAMSVLMFLGLIMIFVTNHQGVQIPILIRLIFIGLFIVCLIFYITIIFFDINKLFKYKLFKRFQSIGELVKKENLGQIRKALLVSMLSEFLWISQIWFIGWYFGTNLPLLSFFIFMPIISIILILPISIGGFGAREQLFLFFFAGSITSPESVLLTSTFAGILGIINALFGGLISLTPDFKKIDKK